MDLDDEQAWVERARHDHDAFRELYDHYFPRVYAYVSYRVGRVEDAEDLVGETFTKVVEGLGGFEWRRSGSFAAWLFRIAHNCVSNLHRYNRHRQEPVPLEALPNLRAMAPLPDDVVVQKEEFAHLRGLIATLSPRKQEVITLRFYGRLRNREIAQILGLDERTVAAHLCRGLEELHRKYLDELARAKDEGIL